MSTRLTARIADLDWNELQHLLDEHGYATIPSLLNQAECTTIINTYEEEKIFRKTINMARYRFGIGEIVIALNQRDQDFTGGELLLTEQRPRAQSRGHVIKLQQGEALIFPTNHRPVLGARGYYKATLRHGVSTITSGTRYSLGVIFRDAK